MFLPLQKARKFSFYPRYYNPAKDEDEDGPRIKFRRLLKSPRPTRQPVRRYLILAIGILFLIWYLNKLQEPQALKMEEIRIEDVSPR